MNIDTPISSYCDSDNDGIADGNVACDTEEERCILCGSNGPTTPTKTTTTVTIPTTSASDKSSCGFILALIPFLYGLN